MLNYLYAVLESEASLAAAVLGLDPGLGFIHVDTPARDSLACDLMEAVRPKVDAYVLDWIMSQPLKREWFFEQRDGNCRLMASFAIRLSETAPMWRHAIAPVAEWVARALWSNSAKPARQVVPPTRLTQRHKREAKGAPSFPIAKRVPQRQKLCPGCGKDIRADVTHCGQCAIEGATQRLADAARLGRLAARTPEARAKQAASQRQQAKARSSWTEIEPTSLADCGSLFRENSATACGHVELSYRLTDRGISLVCRAHPPWPPPASTALAGAGATRGYHSQMSLPSIHC